MFRGIPIVLYFDCGARVPSLGAMLLAQELGAHESSRYFGPAHRLFYRAQRTEHVRVL